MGGAVTSESVRELPARWQRRRDAGRREAIARGTPEAFTGLATL